MGERKQRFGAEDFKKGVDGGTIPKQEGKQRSNTSYIMIIKGSKRLTMKWEKMNGSSHSRLLL